MSNIENIKARIKNLNSSIQGINSQTDANVAKKQLLEQQFADGCETFKKKYGIEVDASNIVTKRDEALAEQEEQLNSMELIVSHIQSGNVEEACRLLGVPMDTVKPQTGTIAKAEVSVGQEQGAVVPQGQPTTTGGTTSNAVNAGHVVNEVLKQEAQFTEGGQPIATTTPYKVEEQEAPKIIIGDNGEVSAPVTPSTTTHPKIQVNLDDDDEDTAPVKVKVSMADLGKPSAGGADTNVTSNVNEFMSKIGMGGTGETAPQVNANNAEVPADLKASTGSAIGKGLNDLLSGNV